MAEALMRHKLEERNIGPHEINILSAGTGAYDGCPASPRATAVLKSKHIDLSSHRSRRLTPSLIQEADYIFTMTMIQKQQVLFLDPGAEKKTYTLREFIFPHGLSDVNIDDPYGGDEERYQKCAEELEAAIERLIEKVIC
ncbi:hypothetical protein DCMF_15465 [Candidatus Formimonas warabiya]|uniref:Phosphotyrosine protein phosphatase I domain-containing protein n=2 Tax=Formimonas warabiya TaxID=1761012 RepID=A0A3G1L1U9_FORW1|nr:hypothetical protein DCMF_15465 [Candidatus Formimonas warabiya]